MSEKFSIILEDEPVWIPGPKGFGRHRLPVTRKLDFIEATNLDDAWDKARVKWLENDSGQQIVDIIPGELTEPIRPGERLPQKTPPQEEPAPTS
jgi:hypothetical protein